MDRACGEYSPKSVISAEILPNSYALEQIGAPGTQDMSFGAEEGPIWEKPWPSRNVKSRRAFIRAGRSFLAEGLFELGDDFFNGRSKAPIWIEPQTFFKFRQCSFRIFALDIDIAH